jgi:hypothetical protein
MSSGDRQIETHELLIGYAGQALCEPISFSVQTGAGMGIIGAKRER